MISRKVAFIIDGWFMRERIMKLFEPKEFPYDGPHIRKYCLSHLKSGDAIYRILYYDTEPVRGGGHNPISKKFLKFDQTDVAKNQQNLLDSIKKTPNMALRLGHSLWRNKEWVLNYEKLKDLLSKKISIDDLKENDLKPRFEQKTVDMKIGMDIALISTKRLADVLIVISGDADLIPALKQARREGMMVGIDPLRQHISIELEEHVDFIATKTYRVACT